ncbi:MAG: hypothetical protein KA143_15400 [Saprospiraceae bacterium]|nr:hypothetical protein [Saprospiraceae bacterium]
MLLTKLKHWLFARPYLIIALMFMVNLVLKGSRMSYFTNNLVDRQLLFFINKDFSDAINAGIMFILNLMVFLIYYSEYTKGKAPDLFGFLLFYPVFIFTWCVSNLFQGMVILYYASGFMDPSSCVFDWSSPGEYLEHSGRVSKKIIEMILMIFLTVFLDIKVVDAQRAKNKETSKDFPFKVR